MIAVPLSTRLDQTRALIARIMLDPARIRFRLTADLLYRLAENAMLSAHMMEADYSTAQRTIATQATRIAELERLLQVEKNNVATLIFDRADQDAIDPLMGEPSGENVVQMRPAGAVQ